MSQTLKGGLIGTGMIAWSHLPAYLKHSDNIKLTALCDIREEALQTFANKAGIDAIYTDYNKMLKNADIDAVAICTSHDHHEPQTIAAAEAGKHVLLEKPMGRNMSECRNMISANEILHFYNCCKNNSEPVTSGKDNLETIKVIFGIYESSRTGNKVELATL